MTIIFITKIQIRNFAILPEKLNFGQNFSLFDDLFSFDQKFKIQIFTIFKVCENVTLRVALAV